MPNLGANNTYAGDVADGRNVPDELQEVDAEGWSDDSRASRFDLHEHSIRLGGFGVLSMLWHPS